MGVTKELCMLLLKITKVRAVKNAVPLITNSTSGAKSMRTGLFSQVFAGCADKVNFTNGTTQIRNSEFPPPPLADWICNLPCREIYLMAR